MTKFMPLEIVDGSGNLWQPKVLMQKKTAPQIRDKNWFSGYHVYGVTDEDIAKGRAAHEEENNIRASQHKDPLPPFDEDTFIRGAKPSKLSGKPFMLEQAANQYAELQKKAGRHAVSVKKLVAGERA